MQKLFILLALLTSTFVHAEEIVINCNSGRSSNSDMYLTIDLERATTGRMVIYRSGSRILDRKVIVEKIELNNSNDLIPLKELRINDKNLFLSLSDRNRSHVMDDAQDYRLSTNFKIPTDLMFRVEGDETPHSFCFSFFR